MSTRNLHLKGSRKFQPRFVGPFRKAKVLNPVTVKLKLPPHLKIHPVFHVSLLTPNPLDLRECPHPALIKVGSNYEFEVKRILDS